MDRVVLDASALLAMMQSETGGDRVAALLLDPTQTALVSTLNWSETFDRLLRAGIPESTVERLLAQIGLQTVDFDVEQGKLAAKFRVAFPALSLADRACLALAFTRKARAWTTDKSWARVKVGVPIEVLR
jgi:ribonuclease VapC